MYIEWDPVFTDPNTSATWSEDAARGRGDDTRFHPGSSVMTACSGLPGAAETVMYWVFRVVNEELVPVVTRNSTSYEPGVANVWMMFWPVDDSVNEEFPEVNVQERRIIVSCPLVSVNSTANGAAPDVALALKLASMVGVSVGAGSEVTVIYAAFVIEFPP